MPKPIAAPMYKAVQESASRNEVSLFRRIIAKERSKTMTAAKKAIVNIHSLFEIKGGSVLSH